MSSFLYSVSVRASPSHEIASNLCSWATSAAALDEAAGQLLGAAQLSDGGGQFVTPLFPVILPPTGDVTPAPLRFHQPREDHSLQLRWSATDRTQQVIRHRSSDVACQHRRVRIQTHVGKGVAELLQRRSRLVVDQLATQPANQVRLAAPRTAVDDQPRLECPCRTSSTRCRQASKTCP